MTNPNDGTPTFSFNEQSIRDIAKEGDYPVYKHYAHEFFHEEAELQAMGHDARSKISKRELAELFAELYKV